MLLLNSRSWNYPSLNDGEWTKDIIWIGLFGLLRDDCCDFGYFSHERLSNIKFTVLYLCFFLDSVAAVYCYRDKYPKSCERFFKWLVMSDFFTFSPACCLTGMTWKHLLMCSFIILGRGECCKLLWYWLFSFSWDVFSSFITRLS